MIIAEDRLAAAPLIPFRCDQRPWVDFEMPVRIICNIFRRTASADPALTTE